MQGEMKTWNERNKTDSSEVRTSPWVVTYITCLSTNESVGFCPYNIVNHDNEREHFYRYSDIL